MYRPVMELSSVSAILCKLYAGSKSLPLLSSSRHMLIRYIDKNLGGVTVDLVASVEDANGPFCCAPGYNETSGECINPSFNNGSTIPFDLPAGKVLFSRDGTNVTNAEALGFGANISSTLSLPTATATAPASSSTCPTSHSTGAVAGVGAALGIAFLIALCLFVWALLKIKRLRRHLQARGESPAARTGSRECRPVWTQEANLQHYRMQDDPHITTAEPKYALPSFQESERRIIAEMDSERSRQELEARK